MNKVWKFISERASWQGGFYERIISLNKHHLKKILSVKLVSKEVFEAIVKEVEFIVNRPITFISKSKVN